MSDALKGLPRPSHPDLLVGYETSDDAAVFRVSPDIAIVSTCDFITPPVDDPWWFGQVAAANAISDVYSMGGRPTTALNLVMFPARHLDMGVLHEILRGGAEKVAEAGAVVAGGHTIDDDEPKYGLSVDGVVHPDRIITNAGARAGDAVILTKPLGSGVLFNAVRGRKMELAALLDHTLPTVASLNGPAMQAALAVGVHGATDVTGFGILGHALEMASGAGLRVVLSAGALPLYGGAADMYRAGVMTGSNHGNRVLCDGHVDVSAFPDGVEELLYDPQTSGGLLLSVPDGDGVLAAIRATGGTAWRIGDVVEGPVGVTVRG